jgi:hypothetical protein
MAKNKMRKLRKCNECGKEKMCCATKCIVYVEGVRTYCGYMRVVR